ncbi:MAG: SIR2 family protein [Phycisphaerae bacterium]|nr:SIR2 family protein [Saprospiraceae bacterium]
MNNQPNHEEDLKETIRAGLAIVVAGTGVSIAASYDEKSKQSHPQASWSGLLENGLQWLKEHKLMDEEEVEAQLRLLKKKNPPTHRFISAAEDITTQMGGAGSVHFKDWLKSTVGSIKAHDRSILDALDAIRKQGNLLATTNYDGLLLDGHSECSPIIWRDSDALIGAIRSRDKDKIIFLHGYWRRPESVILDWNSYDHIARDEKYREDLAAFWKTSIWVYVGCGVNGLSDPDFGLLLQRYGERARQAGHWDYCLVREEQRDEFQAHFDSKKLNIRAISFGKRNTDLPQYLRSLLPAPTPQTSTNPPVSATAYSTAKESSIPHPPAFYAVSDYIGRHTFIGREAQLKTLSEWAQPSDPSSILLFEAIGGNGKSMLTWEWATKHATVIRSDWAGRFWYSFYEKGAIMRQFCQHALAYMTEQPLEAYEKKTAAEMRVELLNQIHRRPWLLILDGLERVLVAYHRIDAAELPDEEANRPTDKILDRDPCDAIRDEDTELLRTLAAAAPSKILISSRLIPRVLLNQAGIPLPGVKPLVLPGLDEADAEELLRSCGIQGSSADLRYYLTNYCGNHPLVIGVLAGLINSPGPHRGNFDAWTADPAYGAKLNLASLDLIQSRNHILHAALEALEPASRQLLSTLALLSNAVDYETVAAFNPHLPPEPEKLEEPTPPENGWDWDEDLSEKEKAGRQEQYQDALIKRKAYEQAMQAWQDSEAVRESPKKLAETMEDLEHRGFLQYDARANRYDLHPVVRGVAAGGMEAADKERYGQRVVDHYSSQPHNPYEQAKTMEDVENGLHVVRTLLKLGHYQQAVDAYLGDLATSLRVNLEAHVETLSLLRPFFPAGWDALPKNVEDFSNLANEAAMALDDCGEHQKALGAYGLSIQLFLEKEHWDSTNTLVGNISRNLSDQNLLAGTLRMDALALDLATVCENVEATFTSLLFLFNDQSRLGQWQAAETTWRLLDLMGRDWSRAVYRQGDAEFTFAKCQFWRGTLQEDYLVAAATLAEQDGNRGILRSLHWLRGAWQMEQGQWTLAATSFDQAVTMARERRLVNEASETGLALAKFHLGQITGTDARSEAERLAQLRNPAHRSLAQLWQAIGDLEQAKYHALKAYAWAWADGEPYVRRYELTKTTELLNELGVPIPNLPPYDPAKDEPFPWEAEVRAAIEKLRAEKEKKEKTEKLKPD